MQKRHAEQNNYISTNKVITTQKYVIPFIEKHKPITADSHILEIGCGEGGNIKPFLDLGCQVTGIDINGGQIAIAKEIYSVHPNNRNLTIDLRGYLQSNRTAQQVRHYHHPGCDRTHPQPRIILAFYKEVLKSSRYYFRSLSTLAKSIRRSPADLQQQAPKPFAWFHLLPRPVYKKVLEWGNVNPGGLLEIKDTGISLERFSRSCTKEKYRIVEEVLYSSTLITKQNSISVPADYGDS